MLTAICDDLVSLFARSLVRSNTHPNIFASVSLLDFFASRFPKTLNHFILYLSIYLSLVLLEREWCYPTARTVKSNLRHLVGGGWTEALRDLVVVGWTYILARADRV